MTDLSEGVGVGAMVDCQLCTLCVGRLSDCTSALQPCKLSTERCHCWGCAAGIPKDENWGFFNSRSPSTDPMRVGMAAVLCSSAAILSLTQSSGAVPL